MYDELPLHGNETSVSLRLNRAMGAGYWPTSYGERQVIFAYSHGHTMKQLRSYAQVMDAPVVNQAKEN